MREGRLLLAAAAVALGDRRLLGAAAAGARASASRRSSLAEPGKRAPAADVALYHVGNDPDAHGWIVDALRKRPGVVVLHEFVLHHLIAGITIGRGDGRGYLDAMERERGVAGAAARARRRSTTCCRSSGRPSPSGSRSPGTVLDLADGLIVHSRYVEERARAAGYAGRLWRMPHPAWPVADGRARGRGAAIRSSAASGT